MYAGLKNEHQWSREVKITKTKIIPGQMVRKSYKGFWDYPISIENKNICIFSTYFLSLVLNTFKNVI